MINDYQRGKLPYFVAPPLAEGETPKSLAKEPTRRAADMDGDIEEEEEEKVVEAGDEEEEEVQEDDDGAMPSIGEGLAWDDLS
ncbi:unnamed protein product [Laminaria digitata]